MLDSRTLKPIAYLPGVEGGWLNFLVFDPKGKYLAFGDVHVRLWDLAVVRDELAAMGLAWDQPKPASLSATNPVMRHDDPMLRLARDSITSSCAERIDSLTQSRSCPRCRNSRITVPVTFSLTRKRKV